MIRFKTWPSCSEHWSRFFRLELRANLALNLTIDTMPIKPQHGPQTWPWWRLISIQAHDTKPYPPTQAWNIWFYTRWGAWCWHAAIDRRDFTGFRTTA